MKVLTRTLSLLTIASLALLLVNCGPDDNETPAEQTQLAKFSKTWVLADGNNSAKLEGQAADQIKSNFEIAFTGTYGSSSPYTFTVKGTEDQSPWPGSGKWAFAGDVSGNSGMISRTDQDNVTIGIMYEFTSTGQLRLTFSFPSTQGYDGVAKIGSVQGDWEFVLKPKP